MAVLCFDVSSSGISAALFDAKLELLNYAEIAWGLAPDEFGATTLPAQTITSSIRQLGSIGDSSRGTVQAICIGSFMHSTVLLDAAGEPLTPVHTWLDRSGQEGVEYVRSGFADTFHERTGCHFHPMFPIFKLAALRLASSAFIERTRRVASIKSFLVHKLTGVWVEDHGMASASGLFNIRNGDWDPDLLAWLGLSRDVVPAVAPRTTIAGPVTSGAASDLGFRMGTPVVNGSGDGFMATLGSDCENSGRVSVSLSTSSSARQTISETVLDPSAGTFCYRADEKTYLLGCASSNGGNVLDWGRAVFGELAHRVGTDVPIFIPLLHGERSPEWDPRLSGAWYGLRPQHTAADLAQSILEGVIFNLAHYAEILRRTSRQRTDQIVLSGNGFLQPPAARLLAAIVDAQVRMPLRPGLATLRGSAVCALRALGVQPPAMHTELVLPLEDLRVRDRFQKYKILRAGAGSGYFFME
jgi:gluconokinase